MKNKNENITLWLTTKLLMLMSPNLNSLNNVNIVACFSKSEVSVTNRRKEIRLESQLISSIHLILGNLEEILGNDLLGYNDVI
jgi:hypothetical protein